MKRAPAPGTEPPFSPTPPTGADLRAFLRRHGLRRQDVADALYVPKTALDHWCLAGAPSGRGAMPAGLWLLLNAKLGLVGLASPRRRRRPLRVPAHAAADVRLRAVVEAYNAGLTLAAIGRAHGITRQRVEQIVRAARHLQ